MAIFFSCLFYVIPELFFSFFSFQLCFLFALKEKGATRVGFFFFFGLIHDAGFRSRLQVFLCGLERETKFRKRCRCARIPPLLCEI